MRVGIWGDEIREAQKNIKVPDGVKFDSNVKRAIWQLNKCFSPANKWRSVPFLCWCCCPPCVGLYYSLCLVDSLN